MNASPLTYAMGIVIGLTVACPTAAQTVCETPTPYGNGTPGLHGLVPMISTLGRPALLGDPTFAVQASMVRGSTSVALVLATQPDSIQTLGIELLVSPTMILAVLPNTTNLAGTATYDLPVPPSAGLAGLDLYTQLIAADPDAVSGIATSHGLHVGVCDQLPEYNLRELEGIGAACDGCTDGLPAVPSYRNDDRTAWDLAAIRIVVDRPTIITRIVGIAAAAAEDYDQLDLELYVFGNEPHFAQSGPSASGALHFDTNVQLADPSPPEFGGQSALGVPNRLFELEFAEFEVDPRLTEPEDYWIVIARRAADANAFAWAQSTTEIVGDARSGSAIQPMWTPIPSERAIAANVFARPACADYQISYDEAIPLAYAAQQQLHAVAATVAAGTICAPALFAWRSADGSTTSTTTGIGDGGCVGSLQVPLPVRDAIAQAAAQVNAPGEVSLWLCSYPQGAVPWFTSPVLIARHVCPPGQSLPVF
ncbi:MAG: hypothetical protein KDB80_16165 [Planctomycetes bacterium]|nr:hypothetical protein [Planctomycetota bacterium]